jgi:hypothetical protein
MIQKNLVHRKNFSGTSRFQTPMGRVATMKTYFFFPLICACLIVLTLACSNTFDSAGTDPAKLAASLSLLDEKWNPIQNLTARYERTDENGVHLLSVEKVLAIPKRALFAKNLSDLRKHTLSVEFGDKHILFDEVNLVQLEIRCPLKYNGSYADILQMPIDGTSLRYRVSLPLQINSLFCSPSHLEIHYTFLQASGFGTAAVQARPIIDIRVNVEMLR